MAAGPRVRSQASPGVHPAPRVIGEVPAHLRAPRRADHLHPRAARRPRRRRPDRRSPRAEQPRRHLRPSRPPPASHRAPAPVPSPVPQDRRPGRRSPRRG
ncbi:MAG: hypothetical protein M3308_02190 [Actinomycetota bacterium]|nr:hypothetical protein [Actinomycetota bacterium]